MKPTMPLIFAQPTPKSPSDAQTVPDPPFLPVPPNCQFYGWILEPTLFGEGTIILPFSDGSTTTLQRPTTEAQARDTFELVARGVGLTSMSCIKPSTAERPCTASFAESAQDIGVRSYFGKNLIPSAAKFEQVQQILHLVKDVEWIHTSRYSAPFDRMRSLIAPSMNPSHPSVSAQIAGRFPPRVRRHVLDKISTLIFS
ncbi:hypothetical protein C8J57DRAFT_1317621 [Mycena rebaudengoi]|nr:hypothetical protein C8J57DRAFT_1317621 [Mycena rebaudengoi]